MENKIVDPVSFRFRGLRKDGKLIQSNNIDDFRLQEFFWFEETSFFWFEETSTVTKEMWDNLKLRSNIIYRPTN